MQTDQGMMAQGLALKLQTINLDGRIYTPVQILKMHEDVYKEKGKVYYSTDIPTNLRNISNVTQLLFYIPKTDVAFFADIASVEAAPKGHETGKILPHEAEVYSPQAFAGIACRTWFLLNNIVPASKAELERLRLAYYR